MEPRSLALQLPWASFQLHCGTRKRIDDIDCKRLAFWEYVVRLVCIVHRIVLPYLIEYKQAKA